MKLQRILLPALVVWLSGSSHSSAEDNPFLNNLSTKGDVSLPLHDWQTVWQAATKAAPAMEQKPTSKPPVTAALQSASYVARLEGEVLRCDAVFVIKSFADDWQTVPLIGAEWSLDTSMTAPASVALVRQEDRLCALVHGLGDFEVKLPLSLTMVKGGVKFTCIPAAAQRFTVTPTSDQRVLTMNMRAPSVLASGELVHALPTKQDEVLLAVEDKPAEPPAPPPPPQPSTWSVDTQALAVFQEGTMNYTARCFLRASKGSGIEATLTLPAAVQVADVTGDDVIAWNVKRSEDGSTRLLHVKWQTEDRLDRRVQMRYALPQSPIATEWTLVAPAGEEVGHASFAMGPLEGLEFNHATLQRVPASRVLSWMRDAASAAPELLLIDGGTVEKLTAKALPRVESAKATVKTFKARTRLVADGSLLHELSYEFEHRGLFTWRIALPVGSTLLACKMNSDDVRPVQRSPQELEFALLAKNDATQSTKLTLTYHGKGTAWDRISGSLALELPKTEVFTQSLHWQLELPEGFELVASSDTLKPAPLVDALAADRTVAFQKELFTNEPPAIELFYQRLEPTK